MRKMQAGPLLSLSPSFNSYSSSTGNLADIAARVVSELRRENNGSDAAFFLDDDDHPWFHADLDQRRPLDDDDDHDQDADDDDDEEFEFAFVCRESVSSPISADEIFYNGQIKPLYYPLFGKTLGPRNDVVVVSATAKENDETALPPPPPPPQPQQRRRLPLRNLMVEEERETTTSCSSSEADELDGLQQGTYCVWTPRNGGAGGGGGKKKKSAGSSKRWKIRDLLGRSGSYRKDRTIVVIAASSKKGDKTAETGTATAKEGAKNDVVSAAGKDEDKRKSYKQDLVGFLANVNGLSRNLHPF